MDVDNQPKSKTTLLVVIGLIVFFVCAIGATYLWAQRFNDRIAPNVSIGSMDVGGLREKIARQILQTQIDEILLNGIDVRVGDSIKRLSLATVVSTDVTEDVEFALDDAITQAAQAKHASNVFLNTWLLVSNLWQPVHIPLSVVIAEENVKQNISRLFPDRETQPQNSRFLVVVSEGGPRVLTTPDAQGMTFAWETFFKKLPEQLMQLDRSEIELHLNAQLPEVTQAMAETQKRQARDWLEHGTIIFVYVDERSKSYKWELNSLVEYAQNSLSDDESNETMIVPQINGQIGIDQTKFDTFLNSIAERVERPVQNARLQMENGRVIEFLASQNGLRLDREAVRERLTESLIQKTNDPIDLVFIVEEPAVQTADVNDLGIDQVLGTGTSSYRGSPINRRKNIQNGVNLLNGILIPPGETFSLLNALKPFEIENGYLPELVIKGDKIIPEIGGGLCQIGTTTFRAVMNSGLPVLERQNHSIVVSYYNDLSNNNPGTDATIYEPAPDFKFLNDTDNYILFQAENLTDTQELRFTLWGTLDGRKGSYTPPVVQRWIPVGETQITLTTDLEPGKEKCQEAHIGADASFDYTIVRPDGTIESTTFASHYRPLPRMCLMGVEMLSPVEEFLTDDLSTE